MIIGHIGGSSAGYEVSKSLRFRASAGAYLSRTPSSAGNSKILCRRYRVKRGSLGSVQVIDSAGTSSIDRFYFNASDQLCLDVFGVQRLVTTQVFRDPLAHYVDIGFQLDVANGTSVLRAKILVGGVEVATYTTDTRSSITNTNTNWNASVLHYIGRDNSGNYFDGYISEPIGVDGSTAISSYSIADTTNTLFPTKPSATWGVNGFYLPFNDGTNLTNLCLDHSGNGNNWTASGISLTAGSTYDWMDDTPTNNFAVLNSLVPLASGVSISNGSQRASIGSPSGIKTVQASMAFLSSGKSYVEFLSNNSSDAASGIGFGFLVGAARYGFRSSSTGWLEANGSTTASGLSIVTSGQTFQLAHDPSTGKAWIGRNDAWFDSAGGTTGNPSTGANPTFTLPAGECFAYILGDVTTTLTFDANFGQRPFAYTPPAGFKALCTKNLQNQTITTSGTFTGNASADGPLVWINGVPIAMTINGNAVTFGTHADKTAGGFKLRTSSASYNTAGTNSFSITSTGAAFNAPSNAQGNP